jgi:hypothetical protein
MDFKNFIDECSKTIVGNQKNIKLSISAIISEGSILIEDYPGPDYKLYLTKKFAQNEKEFLALKETSQYIAEVNSFKDIVIDIPTNINIQKFNSIVIWCESFNQFITAGKYK